VKAAHALIDVYERPEPPLHLVLGSDALGMAQAKLGLLGRELEGMRAVSVGTDY
jgi:hypothetical protein